MKKIIAVILSILMLMSGTVVTFADAPQATGNQGANEIVLMPCEDSYASFVVDNKDYKEGKGSLSYTLGTFQNEAGETVTNVGQSNFSFTFDRTIGKETVDASKMDTLEFWFYVSDLAALEAIRFKDNAIELTSSGTCDKEETCWRLADILGQCTGNGWHPIRLHFSTEGSATDWTRLNFLRWYFVNGENLPANPVTIKIDHIRLTDYQAYQQIAQMPAAEQMTARIMEALNEIPEWDEENEEIVKLYRKNAAQWFHSYNEIKNEYDQLNSYAQMLTSELGGKVVLNRVNRFLKRYEEWANVDLETLDPTDKVPVSNGEDGVNTPLIITIFSLCLVAVLADVFVYSLIKKKDRKATQ